MTILHEGQALIITDEQIDSRVLDLYPNLKVIGCSMTGLDHIDLFECRKRGIEVLSLQYAGQRDPDVTKLLDNVTSTAEHTIGLIIALLRNYKTALNAPYKHRDEYMGHSLNSKKLLLIGGLGRVGKHVKRMAEGLGMDVYVYDVGFYKSRLIRFLEWLLQGSDHDPLEELKMVLGGVDVVSIHVPLPGNEGFFTQEMFANMSSHAYFINTARSGVVEDSALIWALETGKIAGAAVDFTDEAELREYASENNNLILTNHIAGVTFEDRHKTSDFIKQKVDTYIHQLNLSNYENQHDTNI
jgi:D-3-phosphoglycerate dehydrogenase